MMFVQTFGRRCNGGHREREVFFSFFISRSPYSTTASETSTAFLPEYLAGTLGFSREESISAAAKVTCYTSTTKPALVVDYLKRMGLDLTQIRKCVSRYPKLLYFDVDKNLDPKLQCLQEVGLSGSDLADVIARGAQFLERGLDTNLKPNLAFLKIVFGNNEDVRKTIKNYPAMLRTSCQIMQDNVSYFQKLGFSNEKIKWYISRKPMALRFPLQWFEERVHMLEKDFGIPRESPMFFYGMYAIASASKLSMEKKFAVFRSFGWADSDIITMFQHQPFYFTLSEANLQKKLDYFMNKVGYTPDFLSTRSALAYSLEKRVLPRVYVLNTLKEKKLSMKNHCLYSIICFTEAKFEKLFLLPYKDAVPELYGSYKSRVGR
nr:transcription termination factor MTERF5, chloroplastic-like [Ipomoea batatas]